MDSLLGLREQEETDVEDVKVKEMAFEVGQEVLMNCLDICGKIVPKTANVMPILQTVKFELKGNLLLITATDINQSLMYKVDVKNTGGVNGSYLFPAKEGIELIKRLPKKSLILAKQETNLLINYGASRTASLRILDSEQFPPLPNVETVELQAISYETLRRASIGALFASGNESTPQLLGIHISNHEGKITFAATDRHRVFRYISDVEILDSESFLTGIIHAKSFKHIVASFKDEKHIEMGMSKNYLILRNSSMVYFGKLLEAEFPDLRSIFKAADQGTGVTLQKEELDNTLFRALSLESENHRVTFEVDESGEFIIHKASENSELREGFPDAVVESNEFPTLKLNGKFVRDALLMGDPDVKTVHFKVTGSKSPMYVTFEGDPSVIAILLPLM